MIIAGVAVGATLAIDWPNVSIGDKIPGLRLLLEPIQLPKSFEGKWVSTGQLGREAEEWRLDGSSTNRGSHNVGVRSVSAKW
jgi:hypothetical protein